MVPFSYLGFIFRWASLFLGVIAFGSSDLPETRVPFKGGTKYPNLAITYIPRGFDSKDPKAGFWYVYKTPTPPAANWSPGPQDQLLMSISGRKVAMARPLGIESDGKRAYVSRKKLPFNVRINAVGDEALLTRLRRLWGENALDFLEFSATLDDGRSGPWFYIPLTPPQNSWAPFSSGRLLEILKTDEYVPNKEGLFPPEAALPFNLVFYYHADGTPIDLGTSLMTLSALGSMGISAPTVAVPEPTPPPKDSSSTAPVVPSLPTASVPELSAPMSPAPTVVQEPTPKREESTIPQFRKVTRPEFTAGVASLTGQDHIKTSLWTMVRDRSDSSLAKRPQVAIFAGNESSGRRTAADLVHRLISPDTPMFRFDMLTDGRGNSDLASTALLGGTASFVGAEALTDLMTFLIRTRESGGVLFFENVTIQFAALLKRLVEGEVQMSPLHIGAWFKSLTQTAVADPISLQKRQEEIAKQHPAMLAAAKSGSGYRLELSPKHIIVISSQAGSEIFGGVPGIDGRMRPELLSDEDVSGANRVYTASRVKNILVSGGFPSWYSGLPVIIFQGLTLAATREHVNTALATLNTRIARFGYSIRMRTPTTIDDITRAIFQPSQGANGVYSKFEELVTRPLLTRLDEEDGRQGEVIIGFETGNERTRPTVRLEITENQSNAITSLNSPIGDPVPNYALMLKRAREKLRPALNERIVGHHRELTKLADSIEATIAMAAQSPLEYKNRVTALWVDSTAGMGKTETAGVLASVFFQDARSMVRIECSQIVTYDDFYTRLVDPLTAAAQASGDGMLIFLDEFHRLFEGPLGRTMANLLMQILDTRELPVKPGSTQRPVRLPPLTMAYLASNLSLAALSGNLSAPNAQIRTQMGMLAEDPTQVIRLASERMGQALVSRLGGSPIILLPNGPNENQILMRRWFQSKMGPILEANRLELELSEKFVEYIERHHHATLGFRQIERLLESMVVTPVIQLIGAGTVSGKIVVDIDSPSDSTQVVARVGSKSFTLAKAFKSRGNYTSEARDSGFRRVAVHEANHWVLAQAGGRTPGDIYVYDVDAGATIVPNDGGNSPNLSTIEGIKQMALIWGGQLAELAAFGDSTIGASSDMGMLHEIAVSMVNSGAVPNLPQIVLGGRYIRDERGGYTFQGSSASQRYFDGVVGALKQLSQRVGQESTELNANAIDVLAKLILKKPDQRVTRDQALAAVGSLITPIRKEKIMELASAIKIGKDSLATYLVKPVCL